MHTSSYAELLTNTEPSSLEHEPMSSSYCCTKCHHSTQKSLQLSSSFMLSTMHVKSVYLRCNSHNHVSTSLIDSAEKPCECTYPSCPRIEMLPLQLTSRGPCERQIVSQSPAQKRLEITLRRDAASLRLQPKVLSLVFASSSSAAPRRALQHMPSFTQTA